MVESRPGAGINIAGELVAKSAPDGYMLFVSVGAMPTNSSLDPNIPFDPVKDFAPVIGLPLLSNVIVVNELFPVANIQELIAYAKASPDTTSYTTSSAGSTGHLSCELFNLQTGTKVLHVSFKGSAGAIAVVVGGQVPVLTHGPRRGAGARRSMESSPARAACPASVWTSAAARTAARR